LKNSSINWTENTFNPWEGCTKLGSPGSGCDNCYAAANDARHLRGNAPHWGKGMPRRIMSDAYWEQPLAWDRQAARAGVRPRVFCASTADWADDEAPADQRDRLFELIRNTPNLDWSLLTKRATRIREYLPEDWGDKGYPNVWLGVSVENKSTVNPESPSF
jgi:protein gp37